MNIYELFLNECLFNQSKYKILSNEMNTLIIN